MTCKDAAQIGSKGPANNIIHPERENELLNYNTKLQQTKTDIQLFIAKKMIVDASWRFWRMTHLNKELEDFRVT